MLRLAPSTPLLRQVRKEMLPSLASPSKGIAKPPSQSRQGLVSSRDWITDSEAWAAVLESGVPVLIIHGRQACRTSGLILSLLLPLLVVVVMLTSAHWTCSWQDRIVPVGNSRRLAAALPTISLIEFEDCGHCPQEEMPEKLAEVITEFVSATGGL